MRALTLLSWTLCALLLGVLVWGLDRGFCPTDEGFYLAETAQSSQWQLSQFGVVTRAICLGPEVTVIGSRVARLIVMLAAAAAFGAGWARWARAVVRSPAREWLRPVRTIPWTVLAATLAWGYYPQSLSYNTVTAAGCLLVGGGVLAYLAGDGDDRDRAAGDAARRLVRTDRIALAGAAAASVWVLPVKTPAAVLLILGCAAVLVLPGLRRGGRGALPWLVSGLACGVATVWAAACTPREWIDATLRIRDSLRDNDHGLRVLVVAQAAGVRDVALRFLTLHGPAVALAAAGTWLLRTRPAPAAGARRTAAFALWGAALLAEVARPDVWRAVADARSSATFHLLLACVVLLVGALPRADAGADTPDAPGGALRRDPRFVAGLLVMLALPAVGMIGTDVPLDAWFLQYGAPWVAALTTAAAIAAAGACTARGGAALFSVLVIATAALEAGQTATGFVLRPYRVGPEGWGLLDQTEPVTSPRPLRGLRLRPEQARFFTEMEACVRGADAPPPGVIAIFDMPGVVYALEVPATGCSWLFRRLTAGNTRALRSEAPEKLRGSWVLRSTVRAPKGAEFLQKVGLPFPDGYRLVAAVPDPYFGGTVEVWRPAPR